MDNCNNINILTNKINKIIDKPDQLSHFLNEHNIKNVTNCNNINIISSDNNASIEKCAKIIDEICKKQSIDNDAYEKCKKIHRPSMKNINQSNEVKLSNKCLFSLLNNKELDNNKNLKIAIQLSLANENLNCNNVDISKISNCLNTSIINQKNNLDACYIDGVDMLNSSKIISECIIGKKDKNIYTFLNYNYLYLYVVIIISILLIIIIIKMRK
jgi:hypothetical protein